MKVYGYCRISTQHQSIERQIRNIKKAYPDAHIVQEVYTGTKVTGRPEWNKLYKQVKKEASEKKDVTIVFDSVSRMSRNADEGLALYEELYNLGVNLVFLKERHIDTATYKKALQNTVSMTGDNVDYILTGINQYLMALARDQIRLAFQQAQKEVDDLHERTREGIETARLNGKQIGQKKGSKLVTKKSIEKKEKIRQHSKEFGGSLNDKDCMDLTGLSRNTFYKYKKELREEQGSGTDKTCG